MRGGTNPSFFFIKEANIKIHKTDKPVSVFDLPDTHQLPGKQRAEVDFSFADTDSATLRYAHRSIMEGIEAGGSGR